MGRVLVCDICDREWRPMFHPLIELIDHTMPRSDIPANNTARWADPDMTVDCRRRDQR